ncbi:hypothetical protein AWZ03_013444 [Drosophila navojoa]|uniref:Transmembrane protein n=1 Tax=Drosophila navojoa TaxID=7232 RepID=A0A484AUP9_DRONA|nr:hypothetical protein AWZ03_013444 [Drosophila navojoa]
MEIRTGVTVATNADDGCCHSAWKCVVGHGNSNTNSNSNSNSNWERYLGDVVSVWSVIVAVAVAVVVVVVIVQVQVSRGVTG